MANGPKSEEKDSLEIYLDEYSNKYININIKKKSSLINNKVISLFSGAGGLDIGLEQAGFRTVVCIDNDADSRETIRYNRPDWKMIEDNTNREPGDIRSITSEEILEFAGIEKGESALVMGGAPCQPFSNIGKKLGIKDKKDGDLFLEFVRVVEGTEPRCCLFENVTGIAQNKHSDIISYMKNHLSEIGYNSSYMILNAANYGVPQKRLRFILLGFRDNYNPGFPLPTNYKNLLQWEKFIKTFDYQPPYKPDKWLTVGDAFSRLPKNYTKRFDYSVMNNSAPVIKRMGYIKPGENFKVLPMDLRPNCWKNGKHQGHDTFGRLKLDEPSVTIRTAAYNPSKGKYIHPTENRGLNTVELAALQGFPYDWQFKTNGKKPTLTSVSRQIGNAVPPPLAKALGLSIKQQLNILSSNHA